MREAHVRPAGARGYPEEGSITQYIYCWRFDPVGRMHLCYCFRHTRQLKKAVKASVVIETGGRFKASRHLISIIETIRAASLLDIFELHNDPEILPIAQKTLGKAWSSNQSQEACRYCLC